MLNTHGATKVNSWWHRQAEERRGEEITDYCIYVIEEAYRWQETESGREDKTGHEGNLHLHHIRTLNEDLTDYMFIESGSNQIIVLIRTDAFTCPSEIMFQSIYQIFYVLIFKSISSS